MNYKPHPAAEIFPMMSAEEFDGLVIDIKAHGLLEPVVLYDGKVLDGRNRLRACQQLNIEPRFEHWPNGEDPHEYVVSKNLHRRHLNESQRAMVAAKMAILEKGQVASQRVGDRIRSPSIIEAADALSIGKTTVIEAKKVLKDGTPEEIAAVESGEIAASTVAKQIRKGIPKEQRKTKRAAPLSQTGKNPERIEKQRIKAEIWGRVRDALTHLTSLPLPTDVVSIARASDKTGLVDDRLARSLKWLKDFENEWNQRD